MKRPYLSFRAKLVILYIVFTILPMFCISVFFYTTYVRNIQSSEDTLLNYSSYQTVTNLERKLIQCKEDVAVLLTDSEAVQYSKLFNESWKQLKPKSLVKNKLQEKFSDCSGRNQYITGIALISNRSDVVSIHRGSSDFESMIETEYWVKEFFRAFNTEEHLDQIRLIAGAELSSSRDLSGRFYMVYPMVDAVKREIYGVLVTEFDNQALNSIILPETTVLENRISVYSNIADDSGKIICSPEPAYIGKDCGSLPVYNQNYVIQTSRIPRMGLNFHLVYFKEYQQKNIRDFQQTFLGVLGLVSLCFIMGLLLITRQLYTHAAEIVTAMRNFRKTQVVNQIDITREDEVMFTIADQFNKMSKDLSDLMNELKEKNVYIEHMSNLRRKAEIKAIEAQINPHFIYNALDRINWIAIDNEEYEISEMLNDLASILRYSINNIDMLVPLRAELEWMRKYIGIQSERFGLNIGLSFETGDDTIDFLIYKMLLQPLVENSILRGFDDKTETPKLRVASKLLEDGRMELSIGDNGCGMTEGQLEKIREIIREKGSLRTEGIGINNIVSRLHLYYGEQAEISVKSREGKGTVFVLIIPYKEDEIRGETDESGSH